MNTGHSTMKNDTHDIPPNFPFKMAKYQQITTNNQCWNQTGVECKWICVWDMRLHCRLPWIDRINKKRMAENEMRKKWYRTEIYVRAFVGDANIVFSKEPKSNTVKILLFNFGFSVWWKKNGLIFPLFMCGNQ